MRSGCRVIQETFVFGPGRLEENGAHADHEHVDVEDLRTFSGLVAELLVSLAEEDGPVG